MYQQYDPTFVATGTNPRGQITFLNTKINAQLVVIRNKTGNNQNVNQ